MSSLFISQNTLTCHKVSNPILRPFISHYAFRRILIPNAICLKKEMPLRSVSALDFFIGDDLETEESDTGKQIPFSRCTFRGPRTRNLYNIRLKGHFISFSVKFKPTGLYKLFDVPMEPLVDKAVPVDLLGLFRLNELAMQLLYAKDIAVAISVVEPYLLRLAERRGFLSQTIESAAQTIRQSKGITSIFQLATDSNLSVRQLERGFRKEVGVSPKTYARMLRFEHLIKAKMNAPSVKWSALACESGYFDQMHMVKEFKQFLDTTPSAFIPADFAF